MWNGWLLFGFACRTRAFSRCRHHGTVTAAAAAAPAKADSIPSDPPKPAAYPFTQIEQKWQRYWQENRTFKTPDLGELDTSKPKFYALDMCAIPHLAFCWIENPTKVAMHRFPYASAHLQADRPPGYFCAHSDAPSTNADSQTASILSAVLLE